VTRMQGRLNVSGNPILPMLALVPLGLFVTALIFDLFHLLGGPTLLAETAYWTIVGGLFGSVMAGVGGLVDLVFAEKGSRQWRLSIAHGLINGSVLLLFAVIWLVRVGAVDRAASGGLFLIELLVLAMGGVSAWLSSELVGRIGAEVDPSAPLTLRGRTLNLLGQLVSVR